MTVKIIQCLILALTFLDAKSGSFVSGCDEYVSDQQGWSLLTVPNPGSNKIGLKIISTVEGDRSPVSRFLKT